jgi:hypothetical protein
MSKAILVAKIFVLLKGYDKLVQFSAQELIWVDPDQHKNKNIYYYSFKTQLRGQPRVRPRSWIELTIYSGQYKNKNDYYRSFKTQLEVRPKSHVGLTIDPGQYKDKNDYYHSFKTWLGGWSRAKPKSGWPLNQCKDKSNYYYSLKTSLGGLFGTRSEKLGWSLT